MNEFCAGQKELKLSMTTNEDKGDWGGGAGGGGGGGGAGSIVIPHGSSIVIPHGSCQLARGVQHRDSQWLMRHA